MIYYTLGDACREASRRESITDIDHHITRSLYLDWPVYEVHPIIAAATTDPAILEQAYEQDEAWDLGDAPDAESIDWPDWDEIEIDCTGDPLDDDDLATVDRLTKRQQIGREPR